MSSNYVFMKAADTEPTRKQLNRTASLKVRDETPDLMVPVQLFYTPCVSASYSFHFPTVTTHF